jgi:EAL domain-containing protein (putative c-di-GMP-specific phosphodiesterase class I)
MLNDATSSTAADECLQSRNTVVCELRFNRDHSALAIAQSNVPAALPGAPRFPSFNAQPSMLGRVLESLLSSGEIALADATTTLRPVMPPGTACRSAFQPEDLAPTPDSLRPAVWELRGRPAPNAPLHEIPIASYPFTIGRRPGNLLSLADPTVSGQHAEIIRRGCEIFIRDLGSTNGTFVNGRRIRDVERLCEGAVLQFGSARYVAGARRDVEAKATIAADFSEEALAHLLFDRMLVGVQVRPILQPVVRLDDGTRVGYEVLARSDLPGLETPAAMFRVATERGRELELSQLLRREGLKVSKPLDYGADFYLNTHPVELASPELLHSLERLREEFPRRRIVLEVHETAVTSTRALVELRARLEELDIRLAYDDFGTGQSRLAELADAPPHILKFDMHLIRGLSSAASDRRKLVTSLVEVALSLNVVPLAEGVETVVEAVACRELGFALAQGFYYGRPAAVDAWVN